MVPTVKANAMHVKRFTPKAGTITVTRKAASNGAPLIMVRVPVSSTSEDRDSDEFSVRGLQSLKAAYDSGRVPYFLDHGKAPGSSWPTYNVLDMIGKWVKGDVEGSDCYGTAELDGADPRAMELARKMEAGLPIGHSVGFLPTEAEPKVDKAGKQTGKLIFHAVDLMETSAVGIPSNPDAVMADAINVIARTKGLTPEALRQRLGIPQETKDMELTPEEEAQIMATRAAAKNPTKKDAPAAVAPVGVTPDDIKSAFEEMGKTLSARLSESLKTALAPLTEKAKDDKPKDDDEKDEKAADPKKDDDEDDKKDAPKPKGKTSPPAKLGQPKARAPSGDDAETKDAPAIAEWVPGGFAQ